MIQIFRMIATTMAPLTLLCAIAAFFQPEWFLPFKTIFKELFAATMFSLGVVLEPTELISTLRKPIRVALGVLTQYLVMPILAFTLVTLAGLPPALALGFIIVGSAPGAMASNVIVYLAGGAVAFSIAMTTVATFTSPLLTPSLVELLGDATMKINFFGMMWTIFYVLVIPLSGGMLLRRLLESEKLNLRILVQLSLVCMVIVVIRTVLHQSLLQMFIMMMFVAILPLTAGLVFRRQKRATLDFVKELAPAIAAMAIIIICAYAVAQNQQRLAEMSWQQFAQIFALVVILNALGYLAGWLLAKLYKFDHRHRLTLAIEIGMQNAGLGVALALSHFSTTPEVALPGALFAVWCILTAAAASSYFRWKGRHPPITAV